MVKIAMVIPTYIKVDSPEGFKETDGFRMLKRALSSLKILKIQKGYELDVVLPFCIEGRVTDEGLSKECHSVLKSVRGIFSAKIKFCSAFSRPQCLRILPGEAGFQSLCSGKFSGV